MPVEVFAEKPFKILYNLPPDTHTVVCIGGRGGMKTYEVSKFIAFSATIRKKRCVILRDEKALIKESILDEIWTRYDNANEHGKLDQFYDKQTTELRDKETGKTLIYTKGFRASNNQKGANLKGPSDIDIAVVEEAEDIRDVNKYNTFVDGLRKAGCLVIVMLNTPDVGHFIVKRFFNTPTALDENGNEIDGYFNLTPKDIPGFVCIQTSYLDNPYLPQNKINDYNGYSDPNHYLYNLHYFYTAIKGYSSSGRKGQVHTKVKPIKLADYMALPFKEMYGQDFGTAAPAGLVGVKFDGNRSYCRQLNYLPMNTLDIGIKYCELGLGANDEIVADNADKKAIDRLDEGFTLEHTTQEILDKYPQLRKGFYMIRCVKGADSVTNGIDEMDGMELYAVEESTDLWEEIRNRIYDQDKYGNYTNTPKPGYDHLMDGWMYCVGRRGQGESYIKRTN